MPSSTWLYFTEQAIIAITDKSGRRFYGRTSRTKGKDSEIEFLGSKTKAVKSLNIIGRDDPTGAERALECILLKVLKGERQLSSSQFTRFIWFPARKDLEALQVKIPAGHHPDRRPLLMLNNSQNEAVRAMTSSRPLVVVHGKIFCRTQAYKSNHIPGPPGTGKTTTIAAAAEIWARPASASPTWIVAHSNVAVKNIAEKLHANGIDFKIIVSKEFYVGWSVSSLEVDDLLSLI